MSEPAKTPGGRSSVLYALGRLEAQNEEQTKKIEGLPALVAEMFNPRITLVENTLTDHSRRLSIVERRWWILVGITGAVTTLVSAAEGFGRMHHG